MGYGSKWHNLTSSGSQISILRVRGPKWHLGISSRAAGVFNSIKNMMVQSEFILDAQFKIIAFLVGILGDVINLSLRRVCIFYSIFLRTRILFVA